MTEVRRLDIRRIVLAAAALIILASAAAILYLYTHPIDLTGRRALIESLIEERTTHRVTMEGIVVKVLPSPDISIKGLKVFDGKDIIIRAGTLRLRTGLLSPFRSTVVIQGLEAEGAEVLLKRDSSGTLNLVDYSKRHRPRKRVVIEGMRLRDSAVSFTDEFPPGKASFDIKVVESRLGASAEGFSYSMRGRVLPDTALTLSGEWKDNTVTGELSAKDIDLAKVLPYVREAAPGVDLKGKAVIDAKYSAGTGGEAIGAKAGGRIEYRGLTVDHRVLAGAVESPRGSADFEVSWTGGKGAIRFDKIDIALDGFSLKGSFGLKDIGVASAVEANISTTEMPAARLVELIPVKALPVRAGAEIKKIKVSEGEAAVKRLVLRSPVRDIGKGLLGRPGALEGALSVRGLSLDHPSIKGGLKGVSGEASLKDGALTLAGFSGGFSHGEIRKLDAVLKDLTGAISYSAAVDTGFASGPTIALLRDSLKDRQEIRKFENIEVSGPVELKLSVEGSVRGKKPPVYSGSASLNDFSLTYPGVPHPIEEMSGLVSFDNEDLSFRDLKGSYAGSRAALNGSVSGYMTATPRFDVSSEGDLSFEAVEPLIAGTRAEGFSFRGLVNFKAEAKGTKEAFDSAVMANLTGTDLFFRKYVRKEEDFPLLLDASVRLDGRELTVKKAALRFGGSAVSLDGGFLRDLSSYRFTLSSEGVRIADADDLSPYLKRDFESGGLITFNIRGRREGGERPSYEGDARLIGGHFKTPLVAKPVENIDATAEFKGNTASVTIEGLKAGESTLSGRVDITDIAGREMRFEASSDNLNMRDIFPRREEIEAFTRGVSAAPGAVEPEKRFTGTGTIKVKEGDAWGHKFSDLRADVRAFGRAVYIAPLSLNVDKGRLDAELTYYRNATEPFLFEAEIRLYSIDSETFINALGARERILTGEISGDAAIIAKRGKTPLSSGIDGDISLRSERGRLWKFIVMTKIFSIVNILSIDELFKEGLYFKDLSGNFSIRDGIIASDDLALESDTLRMSAVGTIDMPGRSIDGILAMHPFVTIDKVISSIPLAGWIITGKEKSTVSMYFKVKGPLGDPEIEPAPTKSIEEGVFGILERLLKAPIEVLMPEEPGGKDKK